MRRILVTSLVAAAIYAAITLLIVWVGMILEEVLFVPLVIYFGPFAYFLAVLTANRSAFPGVRNAALRWAALLSACAATSVVVWALVVIMGINFYLALGGRI